MKVTKLFQTIDFEHVNEYESLRKKGWSGFAHVYLERCNKESKLGDKIDVEAYVRLVQLDKKLGRGCSEQLFWCLFFTTKWDLIKVKFYTQNNGVKVILDN